MLISCCGTNSASYNRPRIMGIVACDNCTYMYVCYDLTAIIEVISVKGKIGEVEKHIAKFPNVCAVYDITGLTDMTIVAKFKNRTQLSNFVKKDLALPYVERTNTQLVLLTVKEDFRFL